MFKGFYNLASGMITEGRRLDVISNNMANVATYGFKADRFISSTFDEVMWSRVGNKNKNYEDIGEQSYITAPSELVTDWTSGSFDETGMPLDFAIEGDGYFAIQTEDGIRYTRAGSFTLDNDTYLCFSDKGRVLDMNGQPIQLQTDKLLVDSAGNIFTKRSNLPGNAQNVNAQNENVLLGRIGVYAFPQGTELEKDLEGFINAADGAQPQPTNNVRVIHGMVERSNVDLVREMTEMISAERAYQSAAELTKIYDQVMNRATTEVGRFS